MNRPTSPARAAKLPSDALAIGEALRGSDALERLTSRLRESQQRLADVGAVLPPALRDHVQCGPLDEEGWTLLAANAAVAAKLRNLLPALTQCLQSRGWPQRTLRVKILGRGTA
jgi:hypothetical protein